MKTFYLLIKMKIYLKSNYNNGKGMIDMNSKIEHV